MPHPALVHVAHRPWEVPTSRWIWSQRWLDVLLLHWRVEAERLRPLVPPGVNIDTLDGSAWVSIVPFRMAGVRPRFLPPLKPVSEFAELNVRTYVAAGGKPGVYFLSIQAGSAMTARLSRALSSLPYVASRMRYLRHAREYYFECEADLAVRFWPDAGSPVATGELDRWLTERYCLYCHRRDGRMLRGEVQHGPWPLRSVRVSIESNRFAERFELPSLKQAPDAVHFSPGVDVVAWPFESL